MDYNSTIPLKSVHKLNKSLHFFLCTFPSPIYILSILYKIMHKKCIFSPSCFVFVNFRTNKSLVPLLQSIVLRNKKLPQTDLRQFYIHYSVSKSTSNNASNSSLEIFSFSKRSSAQRSNTSRCSLMMRFASV